MLPMRAIWSGAINFGLINIPVKLYSGAEERELKLRLLHKTDNSPIRYARICRHDGKEIPYTDIVKGYEYQKGDYIVLSDKDFARAEASVHRSHTIDIIEFTDEKDIDVRYYQKPYYVEPEKNAVKAYVLLRKALEQSDKVAIAKVVLRNKEHLAALKPVGSLLVLDLMRFESEIHPVKEIKIPNVPVSKKEIIMALALINQLTESFDPKEFHDSYTQKLEKVIKNKAKGIEHTAPTAKKSSEVPVKDLLATLKKSLEMNKNKHH